MSLAQKGKVKHRKGYPFIYKTKVLFTKIHKGQINYRRGKNTLNFNIKPDLQTFFTNYLACALFLFNKLFTIYQAAPKTRTKFKI